MVNRQPNVSELFKSHFSNEVCREFAECIASAYADVHPDRSPRLHIGHERRVTSGFVRRTFVAQNIERKIAKGLLPFICITEELGISRSDDLVLSSADRRVILTVKKVNKYGEFPNDSQVRTKLRALNCSIGLGLEDSESNPFLIDSIRDAKYFVITYGSSGLEPMFIAIGIPESGSNTWYDIQPISHMVANELPSPEKVERSNIAQLKPLGQNRERKADGS